MVHQSQRLPFSFEPRDHLPRVHACLNNLKRDLAVYRFLLLGHIDDAEAPFADLLQQFVTPDHVPAWFQKRIRRRQSRCLTENTSCFLMSRQERLNFLTQFRIASTSLVEKAATLSRRFLLYC